MLELPGFPPLEGDAPHTLEGGTLTLHAHARTDLFLSPAQDGRFENAPHLTFATQGDFMLSATLEVGLESTFDAGALLLWQSPGSWAKLCLERSPLGEAMVVSVVTKRGVSDDCNSEVLSAPQVRYRVSRRGPALAFHFAHAAGQPWRLVRHFSLESGALEPGLPLRAGVLVQSPLGEGCVAHFHDLRLEHATLEDIRSGR